MLRAVRTGALRSMVIVTMGAAVMAGCSDGPNPFQAAAQSTTSVAQATEGTVPEGTATDGTSTDGVGENNFIPDRDLSDCVGALERPNCGSEDKGTLGTYLVFLALILGIAFIMWRIARGVKARDAVVNNIAPEQRSPGSKPAGDPPTGPATA